MLSDDSNQQIVAIAGFDINFYQNFRKIAQSRPLRIVIELFMNPKQEG
jgi:hypothetical protein